MTGSRPTARDIEDDGVPSNLGIEAARAAQMAHWAATTPDQRLAWLAEAQRFAKRAGALPRVRPASDLEGWD